MGAVMNRDELRDELRQVAYEVIETLLAKRDDYGTQNIAITGEYGLAVRIQDKASRLLNLVNGGQVPSFESVEDTYRDLIGYAMIGLVPVGWGLPTPATVVEVDTWGIDIKAGGTDA